MLSARAVHRVSDFKNFDLSFKAVARIDQEKCIRCTFVMWRATITAHQCIDLVAKDGSIVPPGSYDVRSNGKRKRFIRGRASMCAKRIASVAACASSRLSG